MISTGGFSNLNLVEASRFLFQCGCTEIELSGCQWSQSAIDEIKRLSRNNIRFQPHNYFASKEKPFVLNLASCNENIVKESLEHCKFAIKFASELRQKYYSFHAGFLIDPKVDELGKNIQSSSIISRELGLTNFLHNVNILLEYASIFNIKLLIENNVLSAENYKKFNTNPLLMVEPSECLYVMEKFNGKVGLLLDVAHLKVSANTLDFDVTTLFELCDKYIEAYHLSDNNGLADENKPFTNDSWFWQYLKPEIEYVSLEIYTKDSFVLRNAMRLVERKNVKS